MIAALLLSHLVAADRIALPGRAIRVADVVAGSHSPVVIAALPPAAREVVLSRRALAALVARHHAAPALGGTSDIRFVPAVNVRQPKSYEPAAPTVARDTPLEIATLVGPVRITRSVTALESARPGQRLFVRDADGQVFAARVPSDAR